MGWRGAIHTLVSYKIHLKFVAQLIVFMILKDEYMNMIPPLPIIELPCMILLYEWVVSEVDRLYTGANWGI